MMEHKTAHILLVEDNEDHCKLVSRAFESRGWGGTLRVVATLREARACMKQSHPDLVIADLRLPDGQGIDLVRVPNDGAPYPVIVMTSHGDEQNAVEAMKAGALDYVVKTRETLADMPHMAERALREWQVTMKRKEAEEALQGLREELEIKVEAEMLRGTAYGLTFRELTVLHKVAAGRSDKEIGNELGISPLTAQKHVSNILAKMQAASRTEAAAPGCAGSWRWRRKFMPPCPAISWWWGF